MIPILILAAGSSSRMRGQDKLLQTVHGEALLHRIVRIAQGTLSPVVVALPPNAAQRRGAIADLAPAVVEVADAASGMAAAIRAGIAALPAEASAVLLMLADLPEVEMQDLRRLLDVARQHGPATILRATSQSGIPGHPVLFSRRLFAELSALQGDEGARAVLTAHRGDIQFVALPDDRATTDLDTPEQWAEWRQRTGG